MNDQHNLRQNLPAIEAKLGYSFKDPELLKLSFVHRSYYNEHRSELTGHNERLEFLGDAVLGLLISSYLYALYPEMPEGKLSYLRSRLVEASSCAQFVEELQLGCYLLLGKGEQQNDGRGRDSILADLFEAVIGALYLDGGLAAPKGLVEQRLVGCIQKILDNPAANFKAELQDYAQKKFHEVPSYQVTEESGPDHDKTFVVTVQIKDQEMGIGSGSSKKEAQQKAAKDAMQKLM